MVWGPEIYQFTMKPSLMTFHLGFSLFSGAYRRIIVRFKGPGSWNIWNPWAWRSLDVACILPPGFQQWLPATHRLAFPRGDGRATWPTRTATDAESWRRRSGFLGRKFGRMEKKHNNTNTLGISKLKKSAALNDLFSLPYVNDDGNLSALNRSLKPKP